MGKPFVFSKTIWFNVICGVLIVLETQVSVLTPLFPASVSPWLLLGLPIINVILRAITKEPVSLK